MSLFTNDKLRALIILSGILCFISFGMQVAWADSKITATINRDKISIKQTVSVNVVAKVEGVSSQVRIVEPAWSEQGWQVLGRSQMTQMQIINQRRSLEVTYTYQLRPTRMGQLTIGPFKGAGTAKNLRSNRLKVIVLEKAPPRSQSEQKQNDLYAQIKWNVDKKEVWLGERIDASLVVYVLNKLRLTVLTVPDIDLQGFWAEEVDPPRRSPYVSIGGRTYNQKVLKRDLLTPLKAGDLSLPSFDVNLVVGTHSFFTETQEVPQTVPPLKIKVKPLPPNPPKGFKGPAVGKIELMASIDRSRIREDEGVQFTVRTITTGMLANTPALELAYIDGVRIFPPTERTNTQNLNGQERSVRTQTWLIKPERSGSFIIPQISFPFFDPRRGEYDFAKTRPLKFKVMAHPKGGNVQSHLSSSVMSKGSNSSGTSQAKGDGQDISSAVTSHAKTAKPHAAEQLGIQLQSIMIEEVPIAEQTLPNWFWWLIGFLGPVALIISELLSLMNRITESKSAGRTQSKAGKTAIRMIEQLNAESLDYAALDEAICTYLENRFQSSFRGLTREQTSEKLNLAGLSVELIEGYKGLAEAADFARFAPGADSDQGQQVQRLAKAWVKLAEEHLKISKGQKVKTTSMLVLLALCCISTFVVDQFILIKPILAESTSDTSTKNQLKSSEKADELFWSGRYMEASKLYTALVQAEPHNPKLWYNLGTSQAHEGQFGQAAYSLHKAEQLAPHAVMIKEQIGNVNQAIIEDGIRHPGNRRLVLPDEITSGGGILAFITTSSMKALCLSSFSMACFLLLIVRRSQLIAKPTSKQLKKLASLRAFLVVLFVLSIISALSWWAKYQSEQLSQGIVVVHRAALHRGPGAQYEVEVNIAGGVQIEQQGQRNSWQRVKLSDGREGWLRQQDLKNLSE